MSASECGSPPPFSIVSSEIDTHTLWGKTGSGSGDRSLKEPNHCDFRSSRTPHTRFTRSLSQKGVARAGVRASAAAFEYWPLSLGLLISSGFQAAGGSSGRSFQGAVAPVPGPGLQEIACGARQAEVFLGSGPELEELLRSRGPSHAGGQTQRLWSPHLWHLKSLDHRSCAFSFPAARVTFSGQKARPSAEAPREPLDAGKSWGPISCGQSEGQVGREGGWYRGLKLWLLGCQRTWLGRRGREPSTTANPTPPMITDDHVHLHNGNEVFVPRVGRANFKAISPVNSPQRSRTPSGNIYVPQIWRITQSRGRIGLRCLNLLHLSRSWEWVGARCSQPNELELGGAL